MDAYKYFQELDARLEALSIEDNAIAMGKYMKNHFQFYGIKSPIRKLAIREHKNEYGLLAQNEIEEFVHLCWDHPCREMQYSCMELIEKEKKPAESRIELYEWMILNKSWWDSVDFIAPNLMGKLLSQNSQLIESKTDEYVTSGELWLQRAALIFQLRYKEKTDLDLLFNFCVRLIDEKNFFIRKAIGWSLRQAGKFYPSEVIRFVESQPLSNLSNREALKHLK